MNRWLSLSLLALLVPLASFAAPASADEPPRLADAGPGRNETDAVLERRREEHDASGVTFDIRASILVPEGDYVNGLGMSSFGPGSAISFLLGFHPTRNFGVVLGLRGSFGHAGFSGCDASSADSGCGGYSLQVPLVLEYDATDRTRGFFLQGGLGLFTSYHAYGDGTTLTFSDTLEYKAQVGWRIPFSRGEARPSSIGLEIFADADFGQFSNAAVQDPGGDIAGSVAAPVWHYVFELGVGAHFTP
jgi:hypothetical protein